MRRTSVSVDPLSFPAEYRLLLRPGRVFDSSCSPEARVWFLDSESGFYLKSAEKGALRTEAAMTDYFHKKGLGAQVLSYRSEDRDWLLTSRVPGEDCTFGAYLEQPRRLAALLGENLRMLHGLSFDGCPVADRMKPYFATARENYAAGRYDLSFFPGAADPESVFSVLAQSDALNGRVLLHGDYCLPNVMLNDWRLSGFIDVGNGGVGDPHVDLFWGAWTLQFNLKTFEYTDCFFDAYGRDRIDSEKLRIVAAAEVFG